MKTEPPAQHETKVEVLKLVILDIAQAKSEDTVTKIEIIAKPAADGTCGRQRFAGRFVFSEKRCEIYARLVSGCSARRLSAHANGCRIRIAFRQAETCVR